MINDPTGNTWTRSEDGNFIFSSDGRSVQIFPHHSDEELSAVVSAFRADWAMTIKTDADRIAELEAQVKALLAKLS